MTKISILFLLILIYSCKGKTGDYPAIQDRDSIIENFFQVIDSLPYADTLDLKLKLLRAYYKNDTAYLSKVYNETAELLKHREKWIAIHFCEESIPINTLNYDEAYRFIYKAAFCDKSVAITIGKKLDSITLDIYLYKVDNRTDKCDVITHTMKQLSRKNWDTLIKGLNYADFWGLEEDNKKLGVDGSSLLITGYQKPRNAFKGNYKKIYRWAAEETAIGTLFKEVLDMSDTEVDCFHY